MPVELLADIVELLAEDASSLANLALVNIDCRQMARSAQFVEVCFDYSITSRKLLLKLITEAASQSRGENNPSHGACICRVSMQSSREWIIWAHNELYKSIWGGKETRESYTREQRGEVNRKAAQEYQQYRTPVLIAIYSAMPNLEAIAWKDAYQVDEAFINWITHTPARHLKLARVPIEFAYLCAPPLTPPSLPLRSLYLDVHLAWKDEDSTDYKHEDYDDNTAEIERKPGQSRNLSVLTSSFLRLCSPTLESLTLKSMAAVSGKPVSIGSMTFPRLRHFCAKYMVLAPDALTSILTFSLRELDLGSSCHWPPARIFEECEPLLGLQSLILGRIGDSDIAAATALLAKHTHISKLSISESSCDVLQKHIVPLLAKGRFPNLTSLALHWEGPGMDEETRPNFARIDESSLAAIGMLDSLQQLRLTAGIDAGWRHQWLIDQDVLRTHLSGLGSLRRLALCRDTYSTYCAFDPERYYNQRVLRNDHRAQERPALDNEMGFFEAVARRRARGREVQENIEVDARGGHEHGAGEINDEDETGVVAGEDAPEGSNASVAEDDDREDNDANDNAASHISERGVESEPDASGERYLQSPEFRYNALPCEEIWELCHRNQMLTEAERYAAVMPSLEWIYCGEWPMRVKKPGDGSFGNAVPLSKERDTCRTLLRRRFELGKDDE